MRGYLRGVQYGVDHPAETKALVCAYTPEYNAVVIEKALSRTLPYWNVTGQVDMEGLAVAGRATHCHFDLPMRKCNILLDGVEVIHQGEVVAPDLRP